MCTCRVIQLVLRPFVKKHLDVPGYLCRQWRTAVTVPELGACGRDQTIPHEDPSSHQCFLPVGTFSAATSWCSGVQAFFRNAGFQQFLFLL